MNILYLSSHAVLEYDQTKLWTDLGYDVFSIGAYTDPRNPAVDLRPAIDAPFYSDLADLCREQRERHPEPAEYPIIDWAKADLHQGLIDWADTIIVDCYPESWIALNWPRIREKRVIWRTIGQSGYETERRMQILAGQGLQIVRYSPAEKRAYGQFSWFAGEDALIRFGKDPEDWYGWTGDWLLDSTTYPSPVIGSPNEFPFAGTTKGKPFVLNLAQHDSTPHGRDQWIGWPFWEEATKGLQATFGGPNSELILGLGALDYELMRKVLRGARAYLYCGTKPASYTLGLIEAMMTGTPVVSVGKGAFGMGDLFEGDEIANSDHDDPLDARMMLALLLDDPIAAAIKSQGQRQRAIDLFGIEIVGRQWLDFLGSPAQVTWQGAEAVTA